MLRSQLSTCSDPHFGRCSDPLPWDPVSSIINIHTTIIIKFTNVSVSITTVIIITTIVTIIEQEAEAEAAAKAAREAEEAQAGRGK